MARELRIDIEDMDKEWVNQPVNYHFLSSMVNDAELAATRATIEKERVYGSIFTKEKSSKDTSYYKAHFKSPSDDYADAVARKSLKYLKAAKAEADAIYMLRELKSAMFAYQQRAAALEQLSINRRQENKF